MAALGEHRGEGAAPAGPPPMMIASASSLRSLFVVAASFKERASIGIGVDRARPSLVTGPGPPHAIGHHEGVNRRTPRV